MDSCQGNEVMLSIFDLQQWGDGSRSKELADQRHLRKHTENNKCGHG